MSIVRKLLGLADTKEQAKLVEAAKKPDQLSVDIAIASQRVQVSADRARQVMAELLDKQSLGAKR